MRVSTIVYCAACGHAVEHRIPDGENRLRAVCPACHTIHYENPRMVVGTIPIWNDEVLLCKRAIEPRYGYWTLPAGFMELDETTAAGAVRETQEEAGATVKLGPLFSLIDIPHAGQTHLFYLAQLDSPDCQPGPETLEQRLFKESDIPWADLAFSSVRLTLEHYFASRRNQQNTGVDQPMCYVASIHAPHKQSPY
ncbi:NUDIX hydrolase [Parvibium lacunae]|uniref:NUDIX hydrolase n=1 Tax=Parvibium lacunae TaxID=1888893 RepID=A0A368L820_9BURK|nr:NUDIX hydrolase [Parvibium lacunae]RCS59754.1 NUDIX hydrolase [Parvibium lacunae]